MHKINQMELKAPVLLIVMTRHDWFKRPKTKESRICCSGLNIEVLTAAKNMPRVAENDGTVVMAMSYDATDGLINSTRGL